MAKLTTVKVLLALETRFNWDFFILMLITPFLMVISSKKSTWTFLSAIVNMGGFLLMILSSFADSINLSMVLNNPHVMLNCLKLYLLLDSFSPSLTIPYSLEGLIPCLWRSLFMSMILSSLDLIFRSLMN